MKTTKMLTILVLAMGLMVWLAKVSEAAPMGTAFTYQGLLIDGTEVLDGSYDLMVSLFDDPNEGELRGTVFVDDLDVNDGWFEIMLDFGDGVFDGSALWLETAVRPGELEDPNEYVILLPRREVTPTPYALYAKTAGAAQTLRAADGSPTHAVYVDNESRVGIGTTSPSEKLDVVGNIHASGLLTSGSSITIDGTNDRITATSGTIDFDNENLVTTGNVGIGTSSPRSKLDVGGSSSGAIIRGTNVDSGDGVFGESANGGGVHGESQDGCGVYGVGATGLGVLGTSLTSWGVQGMNLGSGGNYGVLGDEYVGVAGFHGNSHNFGVIGTSDYGVHGEHYESGNWGVLGGNDYGVKSKGDLVVEGSDAAYRGTIGPNNGAPFPRPAYDSGWVDGNIGEYTTFFHNVGGNVNNYVVTAQRKSTYYGIQGVDYRNLTTNSIKVYSALQVRVRIWVYN